MKAAAQGVIVRKYSLLIDREQAMFRLSLWIGIFNATEQDEIVLLIHFAQEEGSFDYTLSTKS